MLHSTRLQSQLLHEPAFDLPEQAVAWMGIVQAQDYRTAKWAVGCRTASADAVAVEQALREGRILRTHLLRPTWHFVAKEDLRWMLALCADRLRKVFISYMKNEAPDDTVVRRFYCLLEKELAGGNHLTKSEIAEKFDPSCDSRRFTHLLSSAEVDGIVCSGADKQGTVTYALFEERVPAGGLLSKEESLSRLATAYFRSHSPATLADFTWWSGLTTGDARRAMASISSELETHGTHSVFRATAAPERARGTHLLPAYDQYLIGYKDRSDVLAAHHVSKAHNNSGIFHPIVVHEGHVIGNWKRTPKKNGVQIETSLWETKPKSPTKHPSARELSAAVERCRNFFTPESDHRP